MANKTYYITVNVIKNGVGCKDARVKRYGGVEIKTNDQGKAIIETNDSKITIYVNGSEKYDGWTSECPNPLSIEL